MSGGLNRAASRVASALIQLGAAGLVAMTVIVGWQVFGRYALASSPSWTEGAALVLMIWYVMLAAAAGVYEGFHIRITLLEDLLGARAAAARAVAHAIVAALGVVLLIYGAELCWLVRGTTVPALGISRALVYLPMPLAGLGMLVFAVLRLGGGHPVQEPN